MPHDQADQLGHRPADYFVVRSPLLPYDELAARSAGLRAPSALDQPDELPRALAQDRADLREGLRRLLERPEIREALFLASPDLESSYDVWLQDPDSRRGQRVERAAVRYVERMATRSTPFGLFAGCAVGAIGAVTRLELPPRNAYRRHTRLDMHYLCGLVAALEQDPAVRARIRYRPTTSLHRLGGRWVWIERTPDDPVHSHRHHRMAATPALDDLVEAARSGLTLAELERSPSFSPALLKRGFFISDLEPNVTGREPIHGLIERLERLADARSAREAAAALQTVRSELAAADAGGLAGEVQRYRRLAATLPGPVDPARLWQVELIKTTDDVEATGLPSLGGDVLDEIARGVRILHRLHRPRRDHLSRFRSEFVSRYEGSAGRREVPLLEALDPEHGLGFGSTTGDDGSKPLLKGLSPPDRSAGHTLRLEDRDTVLFAKLAEVVATGSQHIDLTEAELGRLASVEPPPLPDAFSVACTLAASSAEALARGEFRLLLQTVAGPSGARLAGRFCHGDTVLRERVAEHLRAEEAARPDVMFAEIVHLPEPRTGNVIHRPLFRAFEIVYLGISGASTERQIPIDDLMVSVDGERVVLRSVRHGREVVPRLTSAQNYFHPRAMPVYRFLAALQDQAVATGLVWEWGPLALAPFLPRVTSGRLVLSRARWRLDADEARALGQAVGVELYRLARSWRKRRSVPRRVLLADGDNELLIDFDNVLSLESFAQLMKGRRSAQLVEAFPDADELCVTSQDGRFFHELSVPFTRVTPSGAPTTGGRSRPVRAARSDAGRAGESAVRGRPEERLFPPGSAWLYAKLYAAPSNCDQLLRELVRPFVDRVLADRAVDRWFFIRYADPDWHLRLRLHGDPAALHADVLPLLYESVTPFLTDGRIGRLQLDTYERELERYGGLDGMELSEKLFMADSTAVLAIVAAYDDEALADMRWRLAMLGMDLLLDDLGQDPDAKVRLVREARDRFAHEQGTDSAFARRLGDRFRAERASLEALLDQGRAAAGPYGRALAALQRGSAALRPVAAALRQAAQDGRLSVPLDGLALSYLHMHANRLLHVEQRRQEHVLYDFLVRVYESSFARSHADRSARTRDPEVRT